MKRDVKIAALAVDMKKGLKTKVEGDTVLIEGGNDLYETGLPEGVDMKAVKAVEKYNHDFIDAATTAVVEVVGDTFKKNKKAETATATLPFGSSGTITTRIKKEKTFRNPSTGKEFTAPDVKTAVNWTGAKGSAAYQKRLRSSLADKIAGK
jgi:nucleoid DNA-binding protein